MELEEVYDTYIDTVYKFFYIHSFDKAIAEDLTSQTFLSFVETWKSAEHIQDPKKYLYGIMRNVWLMYLRDKYKRAETSIEDTENIERYVERTVADYSGMSVRERAMPYIERLPEQQRNIVQMRLIQEQSVKDICDATGKDSNYVKTTYKRGVKNLRSMLEQGGAPKEVV